LPSMRISSPRMGLLKLTLVTRNLNLEIVIFNRNLNKIAACGITEKDYGEHLLEDQRFKKWVWQCRAVTCKSGMRQATPRTLQPIRAKLRMHQQPPRKFNEATTNLHIKTSPLLPHHPPETHRLTSNTTASLALFDHGRSTHGRRYLGPWSHNVRIP